MGRVKRGVAAFFLSGFLAFGLLSSGLVAYATEPEGGGELVFSLGEVEGHIHDEDCYAQGGELICGEGEEDTPVLLSGNESRVDSFASLKEAVNGAADGVETQIAVASDITFEEALVIPAGKNIVIKTEGDSSVTFSSSEGVKRTSMVSVSEGATLTLDGDVVFDGSSAQGYVICNGAFTMKKGTMTGCKNNSSASKAGGITVSGENATFTLDGGIIEDTVFKGHHSGAVYVLNDAAFIMNGGSISNNSFDNQFCAAVVIDGASFEMNNGVISGNTTDTGQMYSGGGVLVMGLVWGSSPSRDNAENASFVMNGGVICDNESNRGGGVYVFGGSGIYGDFYSKAYFTMNGGEISGNTTRNYSGASATIVSAGAGIYVEWAGEAVMNGGTISGNSTDGMGGGVATNDAFVSYYGKQSYSDAGASSWPTFFPAAFTMNGGSITGNTAMSTSASGDQGCGGGVYVASDNVVLNAGDISNNTSGKQGGGVYVGSVPYVLTMKDALITGNSASVIGGGIWLCPTGVIDASVNNGAALYGNSADGAADDFAAVHSISDYTATISSHMLGGGLANWYQDGGIDDSSLLGTADTSVPRYDANSDSNVSLADTSSLSGCVSLKSVPSSEAQNAAEASASLTITGNKSARGGGIGSNGDVEIGDSFDLTRELTINKEWVGSDSVPDSVFVWVVIDGHRTQRIELTKDDNWTAMVTGLPIAGEITVEEEAVDNWLPSYQYITLDGGGVVATVTNTYKQTEEPVSVTVVKVWNDGDDANRPRSVKVQLYKDGVAYGDEVLLSDENKWSFTWEDLDASAKWTVDELDVPDGYSRAVTNDGSAWTITNTKVPSQGGLCQTGDAGGSGLWLKLLVASGASLVVSFVMMRRSANAGRKDR